MSTIYIRKDKRGKHRNTVLSDILSDTLKFYPYMFTICSNF